ncbi:TPA: hypothetical protein DEO28_03610 [Candidatus Dependentiae bacterium]|nr:MAG: hypothetical protein UR14_C0007G0023 [candidate division TM6 bacterium GW2011_GWE2_31_21]KKP53616.1 MAG: hypothetical protein UR43_C0004G0157 [candidate division TM6 bacterium GW2011_GWF2_33_332]HBS48144.1 hypothetical protein [Candidatus Dependentiae bacterium]HBZ73568.1 hypothetical protein [Candidatus Dependentiae bacterium]
MVKKSKNGFLLIELLICIFVLSLILLGIGNIYLSIFKIKYSIDNSMKQIDLVRENMESNKIKMANNAK